MTYAGLTTADKGELLDAKAKGYLYVIYRENEPLAFWRTSPDRLDSIIGYDNIDLALAQIAEMETAQTHTITPMTWNERINQMTVEEKAELFTLVNCVVSALAPDRGCRGHTSCGDCIAELLNSQYTEGETA